MFNKLVSRLSNIPMCQPEEQPRKLLPMPKLRVETEIEMIPRMGKLLHYSRSLTLSQWLHARMGQQAYIGRIEEARERYPKLPGCTCWCLASTEGAKRAKLLNHFLFPQVPAFPFERTNPTPMTRTSLSPSLHILQHLSDRVHHVAVAPEKIAPNCFIHNTDIETLVALPLILGRLGLVFPQ